MKLSEVLKENAEKEFYYGVECDCNICEFDVPENLKEIGFIFFTEDYGVMNDFLVDTLVHLNMFNVSTLVEVPISFFKDEQFEPEFFISSSCNLSYSFSVLPPKHPANKELVSNELYNSIIRTLTTKMLEKNPYERFIYPISNFLEYLVIEQLITAENLKKFTPQDEYIKSNFLPYFTEEESDSFKAVIREAIYEYYGSKEQFELATRETVLGVYDKSKDLVGGFYLEQIQKSK